MPPTTDGLIRKTPGVMGGEACIRSTRIPVWVLVGYRKLGVADDHLLEFYPTLTRDDLNAACSYYPDHAAGIDDAIRRNEEEGYEGFGIQPERLGQHSPGQRSGWSRE